MVGAQVWGGVIIATKALAQMLVRDNTLLQCASSLEFSTMRGCYPSSGDRDSRQCVATHVSDFVVRLCPRHRPCPRRVFCALWHALVSTKCRCFVRSGVCRVIISEAI